MVETDEARPLTDCNTSQKKPAFKKPKSAMDKVVGKESGGEATVEVNGVQPKRKWELWTESNHAYFLDMVLLFGRDFDRIENKMKIKAQQTGQDRYHKSKDQIRQYFYTRVKKIKNIVADGVPDADSDECRDLCKDELRAMCSYAELRKKLIKMKNAGKPTKPAAASTGPTSTGSTDEEDKKITPEEKISKFFPAYLRELLSKGEVSCKRGGRTIFVKAKSVQPSKPSVPATKISKTNAIPSDKSPARRPMPKVASRAGAIGSCPPPTPEEAEKLWLTALAKDEIATIVANDDKAELLLKTFDIFIKSKTMPHILVDKVRELHGCFCSNSTSQGSEDEDGDTAAMDADDNCDGGSGGSRPPSQIGLPDNPDNETRDKSDMMTNVEPNKEDDGQPKPLLSPSPVVSTCTNEKKSPNQSGENEQEDPDYGNKSSGLTNSSQPQKSDSPLQPGKIELELYPVPQCADTIEKSFAKHELIPQLKLTLTLSKKVPSLLKFLGKRWQKVLTKDEVSKLRFSPRSSSVGDHLLLEKPDLNGISWGFRDTNVTLEDLHKYLGKPATFSLCYTWTPNPDVARLKMDAIDSKAVAMSQRNIIADATTTHNQVSIDQQSQLSLSDTAPFSLVGPVSSGTLHPLNIASEMFASSMSGNQLGFRPVTANQSPVHHPQPLQSEQLERGREVQQQPEPQPQSIQQPSQLKPKQKLQHKPEKEEQSQHRQLDQEKPLDQTPQPHQHQQSGTHMYTSMQDGVSALQEGGMSEIPSANVVGSTGWPVGANIAQAVVHPQYSGEIGISYNNNFSIASSVAHALPAGFGEEENSIMTELNNYQPFNSAFSSSTFNEKRKASALDLTTPSSPSKLPRSWDPGESRLDSDLSLSAF